MVRNIRSRLKRTSHGQQTQQQGQRSKLHDILLYSLYDLTRIDGLTFLFLVRQINRTKTTTKTTTPHRQKHHNNNNNRKSQLRSLPTDRRPDNSISRWKCQRPARPALFTTSPLNWTTDRLSRPRLHCFSPPRFCFILTSTQTKQTKVTVVFFWDTPIYFPCIAY